MVVFMVIAPSARGVFHNGPLDLAEPLNRPSVQHVGVPPRDLALPSEPSGESNGVPMGGAGPNLGKWRESTKLLVADRFPDVRFWCAHRASAPLRSTVGAQVDERGLTPPQLSAARPKSCER